MWAGYAFSVDFREDRGHAYMLDDQTFTEQCSWVHAKEPEKATEKAKGIVKMAIAKAGLLEPQAETEIEIQPSY